MTILAILVALAVLYWLGSLAYSYLTDPEERSRLNKRPGLMVIALLAALSVVILLIGIYSPFGELSILIGEQQLRIWIIGLIGCVIFTAVGYMMRRG
jgi:amino acid transporter